MRKMQRTGCVVILFILLCLLAGQTIGERAPWDCPECGRKGNTGNFCGSCAHPAPETETAENSKTVYAAGDIITFGHYEQDNNLNNGKEPIEWIVLDYDSSENKVLLLSRYGLDAEPYHSNWESVTWEKCTLRSWLNGEFLGTAFTAKEQGGILNTKVDNSKDQGKNGWNSDGGNNTEDLLFLLSYREAFDGVFSDDQSRMCKPTAYAQQQGAYVDSNGNGWWWLRSPGRNQSYAADVFVYGSSNSHAVSIKSGCVRPAFWLDLGSGIF